MLLKVIACEIAFREICFAAARSRNLIALEFLTQGLHDLPCAGRKQIQESIDSVPEGKFDAILLGYGLCGNMIAGLATHHTPLVIPRAHDCITFFLGSRARHEQLTALRPSAYFYSSGWLECLRRRGEHASVSDATFLPTRAGISHNPNEAYSRWLKQYGPEQARYLLEVMDQWTESYTHGVLIDFDFTQPLNLRERVQSICAKRGWEFAEVEGDLRLLQRWLDGEWNQDDFLIVPPRQRITRVFGEELIAAEADDSAANMKRHEFQ